MVLVIFFAAEPLRACHALFCTVHLAENIFYICLFIGLHQALVTVMACGILSPDQGLNPGPLHWEHGVLATGPSGKSQENILYSISINDHGAVFFLPINEHHLELVIITVYLSSVN